MHAPPGPLRQPTIHTHRYDLGVTTVRVVAGRLELDVVVDLGRGTVGAHWLLGGRPAGPAVVGWA